MHTHTHGKADSRVPDCTDPWVPSPVARSLVAARCECALSKRRGLRDTVPESLLSWLGGRSERWLEKIGLAAEDGYECTPNTYTQNDGFAQV